MKRVLVGALCGLAFGWLARRSVGIEIVHEPDWPPRSQAIAAPPPVVFPAWYREWITAQACVRSRYDC